MSELRTSEESVEDLQNAVAAMRSTRNDMQRRLIEQDAEIERLRERERLLLASHTGCGCDPDCKVCTEKGYT